MPVTYGLTPQGFVIKPATAIKAEMDGKLKAGPLGESAGTEPDGSIPATSLAGQLNAIWTEGISGLWQLLQGLYSSFDPTSAVDAAQDSLGAITGTIRLGANYSTVTESCTGTIGTILLKKRIVTVQGAGTRFASVPDSAEIAAPNRGTWAATTYYVAGDRVSHDTSPTKIYQCTSNGISAGSGGPTGRGSGIVDNGTAWNYVGDGNGVVDVLFQAENTGPLGADAGTLINIGTPVSGWISAKNLHDATIGRNRESNQAFRIKRDAEVAADGKSPADAIRAAVLKVDEATNDPVTTCRVFFNDEDVTVDGMPPHSVEVLAQGGDDDHVGQTIFESVAAGIATTGTTTTPALDALGYEHDVSFSRPTEKDIWIIVHVTYDPLTFPVTPSPDAAGGALIKDAIALYGRSFPVGYSVRASALEAQVFDGPTVEGGSPVPGVLDVTSLLIGLSDPPVASTTIPISSRELAVFDTSRITVVLTPGTP